MPSYGYRVVVFEDVDKNFDSLAAKLRKTTEGIGCELVRYDGSRTFNGSGDELAAEVVKELISPVPASLVVVDWDLTKFRRPVSRELIKAICSDFNLPVCTYQTVPGEFQRARRLLKWSQREIAIDSLNDEAYVTKIAATLQGFVELSRAFAEAKGRNLGETVFRVLDAPEDAKLQLEQYAWGHSELFLVSESDDPGRFATTTIGYWIVNKLFPFPGVLLSDDAAASYLGIAPHSFSNGDCQDLFVEARYKGAFAGLGSRWWRSVLDRIVGEDTDDPEGATGFEIARRAGIEVEPARCAHGEEGAGYFCILTEKAVCGEHSVEPRWLPAGARCSRIDSAKYDQLSAWLEI